MNTALIAECQRCGDTFISRSAEARVIWRQEHAKFCPAKSGEVTR